MRHQCVIGAVGVLFFGGMTVGCGSWEAASTSPPAGEEGFLVDEVNQELAKGKAAHTVVKDAAGNTIGKVAFVLRHNDTLVAAQMTLPAGPESIHGFHVHANTAADGGPGG